MYTGLLILDVGVYSTGWVANNASSACNITPNGACSTKLCSTAVTAAIIVLVLSSFSSQEPFNTGPIGVVGVEVFQR